MPKPLVGRDRRDHCMRWQVRGRHGLGMASIVLAALMFACSSGEDKQSAHKDSPVDSKLTLEQREQIKRLEALGYLSGYKDAPKETLPVISLYDKKAAYRGLNLFISEHAPEVYLMNMKGSIIHHWRCEFAHAFPDSPHVSSDKELNHQESYRRAFLLDNGDIVAIFEGRGLIKMNKDSELLWANPNKSHHDLDFDDEGNIYVITREAMVDPRISKVDAVMHDYVSILSPDGEEIDRIQIYDALMNSSYSSDLMHVPIGDLFHTNTLEILDGRLAHKSPAFKKGNILLSLRETSTIIILDPVTQSVPWAITGMWRRQHQPTIVGDGNILLFDNLGGGHSYGRSRVLEFDPFTQQIVWIFTGNRERIFESPTLGSVQRLANGNTLITHSIIGRAFEVTNDKRIVWEFANYNRVGKDKGKIAQLWELVRLDPSFPTGWLTDD